VPDYPDYSRPVIIIRQEVAVRLIHDWQAEKLEDFCLVFAVALAPGGRDSTDFVVPAGEDWYITSITFGNTGDTPALGRYEVIHVEAAIEPLDHLLAGGSVVPTVLPKPHRVPEGNTITMEVINHDTVSAAFRIIVFGYKLPAGSSRPLDPLSADLKKLEEALKCAGIIAIRYTYDHRTGRRELTLINAITGMAYTYDVASCRKGYWVGKLIKRKRVKLR